MKLVKLHIDSYRHLKNIQFDFTFPKGHEREGQPLDKICIIGQSASGKTSVLELIYEVSSNLLDKPIQLIQESGANESFLYNRPVLPFEGKIQYSFENDRLALEHDKVSFKEQVYTLPFRYSFGAGRVTDLLDKAIRLLFFSAETISKGSVEALSFIPDEIKDYKGNQKRLDSSYIYEFAENSNGNPWDSLLDKIYQYRRNFTQMASELINQGAIGDTKRLNTAYKNWSEKHPNPLAKVADFLNPILNKLGLEIDLVNTTYPIPVISKINDEIIPFASLSTGTKSLLLSLYPLFALDTKDAVILLDEPERSLFPDIQVELMSYYQNLAKESQFIVATHSPFIAAAFEPYERFILYFNEEGKVSVRRGKSPIGDDPNDILSNDFMINYYNQAGKDAYTKYLEIKKRVVAEGNEAEKKKLIVQLAKLGDKYNF